LYPDHSATSQILTDLMLHFAASGAINWLQDLCPEIAVQLGVPL
jgi:hypothetical protein